MESGGSALKFPMDHQGWIEDRAQLHIKSEFTRIDIMDKTVKLRAYTEAAKSDAAQGVLTPEKKQDLELAMKQAQLDEEKTKSLENLKTIVQLRESLRQEQVKTAEMARKNDQLEDEKKHLLEQLKFIEPLRERLKQEQAKTAGSANQAAQLEANAKELAALETRVKDLNGVLSKISTIAEAGKLHSKI